MALGNVNCWLQPAVFELPGYQVPKPSTFIFNEWIIPANSLPASLAIKNWMHFILYAAALNQNDDRLVWDSKYHPEVYCFWLERQSNDLPLLWPSAMKASISSIVRGTHVSSSIPLAVTAMSSSIRTCYREHVVTKVFQLGMRSTSGSDSSKSTRRVSVCGVDATPGRATYGKHWNCPSPPAPQHRAL